MLRERMRTVWPVAIVTTIVVLVVAFAGIGFFMNGKHIMEEQLKDKLRSTAGAASMQFDPVVISRIHAGDTVQNSKDVAHVVSQLQAMRESISNIRYAYIMRRTQNPQMLAFVADADLALSKEQLDTNKNGVIDKEEEASLPGTTYDIAQFPVMQKEAFLRPSVDEHVASDQWGPIISGYAPIKSADGTVVAILGMDMAANEYLQLSESIFSPIALLLMIFAATSIGSGTLLMFLRRRVETLDRLEAERSGLLRLAFHQLGGPLTIISWSLEELEEEGPASIQHSIVNIHEGISRLNGILKVLKDADLIHAGRLEYKSEFASLTSILKNVVKDSGMRLSVRRQHIKLDLDENIAMKLDPKLIAGVAQELITNAIDFSPDGAEITVRSRIKGKVAEFEVEDHGCGIPKNDLHRIFDEFSRASNATRFKADGNGLGLYIVRGIVTHAGGRVMLRSIEGKGTIATVQLPVA